MSVKPTKSEDYKELKYTQTHWQLLNELRNKATEVMVALDAFHLQSIVYGSIARGDVKKDSDIDVFIPEVQNSFLVENSLEKARMPINGRLVVQATPTYAMKAHIEISEQITVTFPLMQMRRVEREFYKFGGEANLNQIECNARVAGVDKRLMLIEPSENGHVESSIIGREESAAKILGISTETVLDRIHTLLKRDNVGRTGVFIKKELSSDETFELALKKISDVNPAVRRRMEKNF
jgi:predicted nucleotidyltransferase